MTKTEQDIDALPEAELLALPASTIPPGQLTEFLSRRGTAAQKENAEELVRELTGATRRRRMLGAAHNPDESEKQQERRQQAYSQAIREIRERQDRLLERIAIEEERLGQRRQEIEERAITLADGRRVYVDGQKYRDEQGNVLEESDEAEAARRHRDNPNASTWQEKTGVERRLKDMENLRRRVQEQRDGRANGASDTPAEQSAAIDHEEREFLRKVETRQADLEKQADAGDPYSAYTGTASSFAAALDGPKNKELSAAFLSAAAGQDAGAPEKKPIAAPVPSLNA